MVFGFSYYKCVRKKKKSIFYSPFIQPVQIFKKSINENKNVWHFVTPVDLISRDF